MVDLLKNLEIAKVGSSRSAPSVLPLYVIAFLSVAIALAIATFLDSHFVTAPVSLLLCATMFSAWFGGVKPGAVSAVLSVLAFDYYFVAPIGSLMVELQELPRFIIFVLSTLFVFLLCAAQRSARDSLQNARDKLSEAVQELTKINEALQTENAERTRAEEAHRRSESYLAEAQRLSLTGSFGWNVSTDEIYWSDETFRIFESDQRTKPTSALIVSRIHPDDRELVEKTFTDALRDERDVDLEHRLLLPDGSIKYIHVLARPTLNSSGEIEYVGAAMDVTERRHAENKIKESEQKYKDLLDLSPEAIYMSDPDKKLVLANRAGLELLGCTAEEIVGYSLLESYSEEELAAAEERMKTVKLGERVRFESTFVRKDGSSVSVEVSAAYMQPGYYLSFLRDISERKSAELQLRRSEAYLAEAQKLSRTGSWAVRADYSTSIYWSAEMYRIMGFPPADTPPPSEVLCAYFGPETWDSLIQLFETIRREKTTGEGEFPIRFPDGADRIIRVVGHPILDENGEVLEFFGTTVDITERRQARLELERALDEISKSEDRLRTIIDTIPTSSWVTEPDGSAHFLSRGWLEYTGLSMDEALNWGWAVVLHPQESKQLLDTWLSSVKTGEPFEAEARFRRANGTYHWCLCRAVPVRDDRGKIIKWYGTTTDIDDRKKAEALLAGEKRLLEMIARGNDLDLILSALCRLVEKILPTDSRSSILLLDGNRLSHAAAPSLPRSYSQAINGVVIGPSAGSCGTAAYLKKSVIVSDVETDPLWADYKELALAHGLRACWSIPILSSDDRVLGTFAIYSLTPRSPTAEQLNTVEQVTHLASIAIERKQAEDQLLKAQAELAHVTRVVTMGELVASIAHEVNQPLGAIVTNGHASLRLLSRSLPDVEKSREVIGRIISDGMRASEVIKRIRDLMHKTPPKKAPLQINDTIQDVIALVSSDVQRTRIELHTELQTDLPLVVGDPIQLQQVILNLILNAKDAMTQEQLRAREMQITTRTTESGEIVVSVRDTGNGFDEDVVGRIFDPFFTTKSDGMGLGLSISRTIIEAHGGTLWATQNDSKGATVQFTLPLETRVTS